MSIGIEESPMPGGRLLHPLMQARSDSGMGRMLFLSVAAHLLVALLFSGWFVPQAKREERPVYYVDLISRPVANPQAGRPDGGGGGKAQVNPPAEKGMAPAQSPPVRKETAPLPEKVSKKAETVALSTKAEVKPGLKSEAKGKPEAKPEAKAKTDPKPEIKPDVKAQAAAKSTEQGYQQVLSAVAALQKKRESEQQKEEIASLQERIAEMSRRRGDGAGNGGAAVAGGSGVDAPLGMRDGTGNEAGL